MLTDENQLSRNRRYKNAHAGNRPDGSSLASQLVYAEYFSMYMCPMQIYLLSAFPKFLCAGTQIVRPDNVVRYNPKLLPIYQAPKLIGRFLCSRLHYLFSDVHILQPHVLFGRPFVYERESRVRQSTCRFDSSMYNLRSRRGDTKDLATNSAILSSFGSWGARCVKFFPYSFSIPARVQAWAFRQMNFDARFVN
jgi:hypothetical protein